MPKRLSPTDSIAAFWARVDKRGDCWNWTAAKTPKGYGVFRRQRRNYVASRFAYELEYGPLPEGMHACHRCDNPACCRPSHMFAGTLADNNHDMIAKGRNNSGRLPGEANPSAKLTREIVVSIRDRFADGGMKKSDLAKEYGIGPSQVGRIISRESWATAV